MIVVPAVGLGVLLGCLVMGGLGYVVTAALLRAIAKTTKDNSIKQENHLTDKNIDVSAKVIGVAVALVAFLLLLRVSREYSSAVWIGFTVLGILVSILWFLFILLNANRTRVAAGGGTKQRPFASREVPPVYEDKYRSSASTKAPPSVKEDYYRTLLAKAMYDKNLADQLLASERKRMPYASFDDLCKSAIAKLEQGYGQGKQGL